MNFADIEKTLAELGNKVIRVSMVRRSKDGVAGSRWEDRYRGYGGRYIHNQQWRCIRFDDGVTVFYRRFESTLQYLNIRTPIINPPQSAILGMHGIFDRPVAIDGKVLAYLYESGVVYSNVTSGGDPPNDVSGVDLRPSSS